MKAKLNAISILPWVVGLIGAVCVGAGTGHNCWMAPSGSIPSLGDSSACPNNCSTFITSGPNGNLFCVRSDNNGSCDDSATCANFTIFEYAGVCKDGGCYPDLSKMVQLSVMYRCVKKVDPCGG